MKINDQQHGFVSIFSALIIMAVLTLITVGFAALSQRAQRRTLDDQLSAQAYYAAESGVNDAIAWINEDPERIKTDCDGGGFNYQIDPANLVEYTCLLVTRPRDFQYSNTEEAIGYIRFEDGNPVTELEFNWDSPTDMDTRGAIPARTNVFTNKATWVDDVTPLRVELVPVEGPGSSLDRATLVANSYVFFLYPSTSGGVVFNASRAMQDKGGIFTTRCTNDNSLLHRCSARVILDRNDGVAYVMRTSGLYGSFRMELKPEYNGRSGALIGGQLDVDVTGKANDVLRRLQVRVPVDGPGNSSWGLRDVYGLLTADSICKRYFVGPDFPASDQPPSAPGDASITEACGIR